MPLCVSTRPPATTAEEHRDQSWGGVVIIVTACGAVGLLGELVAAGPVRDWYPDLSKPTWTPPEWVFGPVWVVLYAMMAVAASLVWLARDREDVCCALTAFAVQLAANLAWSVLFFGLRHPLLGLIDVVILWFAIGVTVAHFFATSRTAGWLLVPYWAWVSYAAALNGAIVYLTI
jgi:tryptophan-rich sensory protein